MYWIINSELLFEKNSQFILFKKLQILSTNIFTFGIDVITQLNRYYNTKFRLNIFILPEFLHLIKKFLFFFGKNKIFDVVVIKGKSIHLLLQQ